jgi:NTP pyrophosphatase (non-canonical NTP hydrolase)
MSSPPDEVNWGRFDDVQREITRWADEQFPGRTDHQTLFKLVLHEVPELLTHKKEKGTEGIDTELADCFILLLDLASMWNVNITEAIRAKMELNYSRIWERDAHGVYQHVKMLPARPDEPVKVEGVKCSHCGNGYMIETAAVTSIFQYHCTACGENFDDNIPF